MNYIVSAWLEHDGPRLGILCSDTGLIKQQWHLSKVNNNSELSCRDVGCLKRPGIQQLTRELFLVGCAQEISHLDVVQSRGGASVCLYCNECIQNKTSDQDWRSLFDGNDK